MPRLTGCFADNAILHCIATNQCPICIAPAANFGELPNQTSESASFMNWMLLLHLLAAVATPRFSRHQN